MALFGSGKSRKDAGASELVLAYLEEAQRVRHPLFLQDSRKVDLPATVQGVDENAGTVTLQLSGPFTADKGAKISLTLLAESTRITGQGRLLENRAGTLVMELPATLDLAERRKQPRARLNAKEGATATLLTGLFDGIGVNGLIENISESGCRVRIEKAINLKDERRLPLGSALFPSGQTFMLIKLNKVPRCPAVMELSGKLTYLGDSGGLIMGVAFEKPRPDLASSIRALVSSRSSSSPTSVPPKARRKAPSESEIEVAAQAPRSEHSEAKPVEAKSAEIKPAEAKAPEVKPVEAKPAMAEVKPESHPIGTLADQGLPDGATPDAALGAVLGDAHQVRNPALLRLKKRTKSLLVMVDSGAGELLRDHLLDEGYGQVNLIATPEELVVTSAEGGIDLILIDVGLPVLECMEFISRLHDADLELPPVVLAAEDVSRSLVMAAHRCGIAHLLVKPYELDEALSTLFEETLGLA